MENSAQMMMTNVESVNLSTGYLEDVLFGFHNSKRRRLMTMFAEEDRSETLDSNSVESCWDSGFETLNHIITKPADDTVVGTKTPPEETISETYDSSLSSSHKESADINRQWASDKETLFSSGPNEKINKKRADQAGKVVYPFSLVKPGGFEGDATLNDINERILMPPTRPVRHPVGDFACRPIVSPHGPGLSGKNVVAFMRIYTQGRRGTITIIRTRG